MFGKFFFGMLLTFLCAMGAKADDLVVDGNMIASGNLTTTGSISASNLSGTNTGNVSLGSANGLALAGQQLSLGLASASMCGALSTADWSSFNGKVSSQWVSGSAGKLYYNSGNVGIGLSSPLQALHLYSYSDAVILAQGRQTESGGSGCSALQLDVDGKGGFAILNKQTSGERRLFIQDNNGYTPNGNTLMTVKSSFSNGCVGIGVTDPQTALDVNGKIFLRNISGTQSAVAGGTEIYSVESSGDPEFTIRDSTGDITRLNSHANPSDVDPAAKSSFDDPAVALPFSFKHENSYIGKGQVIDMAKIAAYVEKRMKAELGESAGKAIYTYDLAAERRTTLEQFNKAQSEAQVRQILDQIDKMPWTRVALGADGKIPDEAFEEIPETETVTQKTTVTKNEIDFATRRLVAVTRVEEKQVQVATGRTKTQLKKNWQLREDGLYRKPAAGDINLDTMIKASPRLPQWVLDRIKDGQQANLDLTKLKEQIIDALHAEAEKSQENRISQAGSAAQ